MATATRRDKPMTFKVEDGRIVFRNFAGAPTPFNKLGGERTFAIVLPLDEAAKLEADGWPVKYRDPRDEGDEPMAYIQVKVKYENKPPRVLVVTSGGQTNYSESMLDTLDYADIDKVDVICTSYNWEVNGKTGISAYLKTLVVVLNEDDLERKYEVYAHQGQPALHDSPRED